MTTKKLSDHVRGFLDAKFPGSTIDDGYYFVRIVAPVERRVRDNQRQRIADRICADRCWIISVGVDPRPYLNVRECEERGVTYNPDWNIEQELPQFLVEVQGTRVNIAELLSAELPSALVFIAPDHGIVFSAGMRRLYTTSERELAQFVQGIEDSLEHDD